VLREIQTGSSRSANHPPSLYCCPTRPRSTAPSAREGVPVVLKIGADGQLFNAPGHSTGRDATRRKALYRRARSAQPAAVGALAAAQLLPSSKRPCVSPNYLQVAPVPGKLELFVPCARSLAFSNDRSLLASQQYFLTRCSRFIPTQPLDRESIYSGFQLDEVHARNPVTSAKPGFSVPHLG
jgi:hypothetical protein